MSATAENQDPRIVELGQATATTRGSPWVLGLLDGNFVWPFLFTYT